MRRVIAITLLCVLSCGPLDPGQFDRCYELCDPRSADYARCLGLCEGSRGEI